MNDRAPAGDPEPPIRVVGIGASAGGLDAIKQVLAAAPEASGMAFVVLQHLAPSQTGTLRAALASSTKLPIIDVTTATRVEPDRIYVVPPRVEIAMENGSFTVRQVESEERARLPIDVLFRSLAESLGARAIGIVLSGTATDGTEGLRAIRTAGGTTFAQDPATAQFDQMPRNAIASGAVSIVLAPEEIGRELGRLRSEIGGDASGTGLEQILSHLRDLTGVDFAHYKRATIERRLGRRLVHHHLGDLESYATYLAAHPSEASVLYEDLLIHVTEFFRDPSVIERLATRVLPEILAQLSANDPIRVWVPGCSTGQEPYSLAILLIELLEQSGQSRPIQIFGTDLSERSIATARAGRYPAAISDQVSEERLARFFEPTDGGWHLKKEVRECCVFVRHDLTADPPFSKLDLISCRNVLIYLGPSLQQGVIPMFHYALNQPGFLVLGRAESIAGFDALFAAIETGTAIYVRKPTVGRSALALTTRAGRALHERMPDRTPVVDIQRDVDHILLARYAPACVLVDENAEIVQYRGRTGAFLEPASGAPQHNLIKMVRGGIGPEVRDALQRARRIETTVRLENLQLRDGDDIQRIHLEVVPLLGVATPKRHFIVVFEVAAQAMRATPVPPVPEPANGERAELAHLRQELVATKEYLHSSIAQHAIANEDLEVANEEFQSMNEELQSMNEELQTAKEELQSTNEELQTVNDELHRGNEQLKIVNDDLVNLLATVDIAIIIVDTELKVRRFTPKARAVLNLLASDVGRRIGELQPNVTISALDDSIARVIETLVVSETEVSDARGACYRMQIRPYRTTENTISGAVISFVDISALRTSLEEARVARDYTDAIIETVPNPLVVLDRELNIQTANRAFHNAFDGSPPSLDKALLASGKPFDDLVIEHAARVWSINARVLAEEPSSTLVGMLDITERVRGEEERVRLRRAAAEAAALAGLEKDAFLNAVSHELRTPLNAILLWTELLRTERDAKQLARGLDTIERSARAETQLVDDLLDLALARTPSEGLVVHFESLDPAPVIEAAIDAVRVDARAKQITLDAKLDASMRVQADPRRLHQIARNLATNAIKFTPDGGRVAVSLSRQDGHVELRVQDTGKGIKPEFLPRVFEPFHQEDQSATRRQQGLGIGLALVRHLVERQGGTIQVASDGEGRGATFIVQLPVEIP